MKRLVILCLLAPALSSCQQRVNVDEARELVERYNKIVSEAYRRADIKHIDPVVGPDEGKKLTGLIGVRLDMGLTMDSKLLELEMVSVKQEDDYLRVRTKEKWYYRDLKIGTGEQVGEESYDSYEMVYSFTRDDDRWLVDRIKFAQPPVVGRKTPLWATDAMTMHEDMVKPGAGKEKTKP